MQRTKKLEKLKVNNYFVAGAIYKSSHDNVQLPNFAQF